MNITLFDQYQNTSLYKAGHVNTCVCLVAETQCFWENLRAFDLFNVF